MAVTATAQLLSDTRCEDLYAQAPLSLVPTSTRSVNTVASPCEYVKPKSSHPSASRAGLPSGLCVPSALPPAPCMALTPDFYVISLPAQTLRAMRAESVPASVLGP